MYICRVQGKCVSTIKDKNLVGYSLITMQRINKSGNPTGEILVAVDTIGCSVGEHVLVSRGGSIKAVLGQNSPADMAVIGIVDTFDCNEK